jgi:hypothetical protein
MLVIKYNLFVCVCKLLLVIFDCIDKTFGKQPPTGLEEKASACSMLVCYAKELKEGFVNYVEEATKLMIPLVRFYSHKGKFYLNRL